MSTWQGPANTYPLTPHVIDHKARPEQVLRFVIDTVEAEGGDALFLCYGRWAKRLTGKVCALLPADFQGQVITMDPRSESPTAAGRKVRKEARLHVSRVGGPDRQPRFEDPHQRTLGGPNLPSPPEQDPQDHQPAT